MRIEGSNLRRLLRHPAKRGIPRNDNFLLSFTIVVISILIVGFMLFIDFFDRPADVEIDGAIENTPSATDTGNLSEEFREIIQFVHDPLPGPFPAG